MAYSDLTSTEISSGKPLIGASGTGDKIKDNFIYLKAAIDAIGVQSCTNINDDFVGTTIDTDNWIDIGDTAVALVAAPDHAISLQTNVAVSCGLVAADKKMRFDLDRDFSVRMITRWGKATNNGDQAVTIGFQNSGLTGDNACGDATSIVNVIAFRRGTNNNTLMAYCAKASNSVVVTDNLGNWNNYQELRIDITFAGATKKVEFFLDGSSVGSTTDTAKIPVIQMRPIVGQYSGSAARGSLCDYARFFFTAVPLSN